MKKFLILIVFITLFIPIIVHAQHWRWADDEMFTHDKLEHAVFYGGVYAGLLYATENNTLAVWGTIGLGILNEIKDALLPWEEWGLYGGDGWSWKDLMFNSIGIATVQIVLNAFDAPIYVQATRNGISLNYRF